MQDISLRRIQMGFARDFIFLAQYEWHISHCRSSHAPRYLAFLWSTHLPIDLQSLVRINLLWLGKADTLQGDNLRRFGLDNVRDLVETSRAFALVSGLAGISTRQQGRSTNRSN